MWRLRARNIFPSDKPRAVGTNEVMSVILNNKIKSGRFLKDKYRHFYRSLYNRIYNYCKTSMSPNFPKINIIN